MDAKKAILLSLVAFVSFSYGETIYVDVNSPNDPGTGSYEDPFRRIQAAIDDANDGDTVIVAKGIYTGNGNRDIDFLGMAITVQSENGAKDCIIDCEGAGRGFYFDNGEDGNSVLEGFTIRDGNAVNGGGIYCAGSSPKVSRCIITGGRARDYGGGIYSTGSSPTISNCVVSLNTTDSNDGGGIYCAGGNPSIANCTITGNWANGTGGGLRCVSGSNVTVSNCILWADSPDEISLGAGASASVTYCDVQGGWTGVGNIDANPMFAWLEGAVGHWRFDEGSGSTAYDWAGENDGTVYGANWTGGITGSALDFDGADSGVYLLLSGGEGSPLNIYNTDLTISSWIKTRESGGTIVARAKGLYITYRLGISTDKAYINTYKQGPGHWILYTDGILSEDTWYHIVGVFDRGGDKGYVYVDGVEEANGVMVTDPLSNNATTKIGCRNSTSDYPFNGVIDEVCIYDRALSGREIEALHSSRSMRYLPPDSPCVDAGDPNYLPEANETDVAGTRRIIGDAVDMGAFESTPLIGVSSPGFAFAAKQGGPNPENQVLSIHNRGAGALHWQITEDCNWLEVAPVSGVASGEANDVNIVVDVSGLERGKYDCELMISDPNAFNSPLIVSITLEILLPSIELSKTDFYFIAYGDGNNPDDQILTIRNSSIDTVNWVIDYDCDWLGVEPNSGSSTGEVDDVNLSVDTTGLALGYHGCELTVTDPNAENSPQTVAAHLGICDVDVNDCLPCEHSDYVEWLRVDKPPSWCCPRHCHGDADCAQEIIGHAVLWVAFVDLGILVDNWGDAKGIPAAYQADFSHSAETIGHSTFRVGFVDLQILVENWADAQGSPPDCLDLP